jgi:predicted dehydrogenase
LGCAGAALLEGTSLKVQLQDEPPIHLSTDAGGGGSGADPMAFPHDWHRSLLSDFLDSIKNNREPRVSGAEALKVHRFIDALPAGAP